MTLQKASVAIPLMTFVCILGSCMLLDISVNKQVGSRPSFCCCVILWKMRCLGGRRETGGHAAMVNLSNGSTQTTLLKGKLLNWMSDFRWIKFLSMRKNPKLSFLRSVNMIRLQGEVQSCLELNMGHVPAGVMTIAYYISALERNVCNSNTRADWKHRREQCEPLRSNLTIWSVWMTGNGALQLFWSKVLSVNQHWPWCSSDRLTGAYLPYPKHLLTNRTHLSQHRTLNYSCYRQMSLIFSLFALGHFIWHWFS